MCTSVNLAVTGAYFVHLDVGQHEPNCSSPEYNCAQTVLIMGSRNFNLRNHHKTRILVMCSLPQKNK